MQIFGFAERVFPRDIHRSAAAAAGALVHRRRQVRSGAAAQRIALVLEKAQAIPAGEQPRAPAQVRECLTKR
ncbi:MAG: hypothetical protein AUI84_13080 [Delftia sp. 13_1_40CM_3_66_6]|nr:MAG: hypothetical protein AUG53_15955 [Delftia sp. 13_1_20CM_4_67_18]OLE93751.1 MAG: hypothetical protein AUI84_13080 [Delftia sp. 13_1_40CM_3_66_6]